jgi:acetyltransferase-like isoleucine patch superfamily enzyme/glycine cleavage system H lipoate-binding protein
LLFARQKHANITGGSTMLEIVLTREDANTEFALLAEWLVQDRAEVEQGQPVCVVETTKATVEVEAPGAGTIVQLYDEGVEVELGKTIARIAQSAEELAQIEYEPDERAAPAETASPTERRATKKAVALAERHGLDIADIDKRGFITEKDVEELLARRKAGAPGAPESLLEGLSTDGVTLPASFGLDDAAGRLDHAYCESVLADPDSFRRLAPDEKVATLREHGADIGDRVVLGERSLVAAPQVVIEDGVEIGPDATVRCEEIVAFGAETRFGPNLELTCRRAFVGSNVWGGRSVRFGGGGHRDPWAVLAVGDLAFVGDEAFVNVCRPVLIGREVYLTMRSLIVTHNIGHSLLEGFENRFAPVVMEDRSQIGLGVVVYAGCRVGGEAIVASGSYVTSDIPAGAFAIGVPAKVTGGASHKLSRTRQIELARKMVDELRELLELRGHEIAREADGGFVFRGFRVLFVPTLDEPVDGPAVVLTLENRGGDPPDRVVVFDLIARQMRGSADTEVVDTVREFCRKRGIRLEPGPWRYRGNLV